MIRQEEHEYVDDNPEVVRILKEGIIIAPDYNTAEKSSNSGKVIAQGSTVTGQYIGRKIVFQRFRGTPYKNGEISFRFIREHEILGFLDD